MKVKDIAGLLITNQSLRFNRKKIIEIISALFIVLYLYTALDKIYNFNFFRAQLTGYPYIQHYPQTVALVVPMVEIAVSCLLYFSVTRRIGLYAALLLITVFTVYLILMLMNNAADLPCTCGGVLKNMTWKQHIVFNISFVFLALSAIRLELKVNK